MLYLPIEASEKKAALRRELLPRRRGIFQKEKQAWDTALIEHLTERDEFRDAETILFYYPVKGEPNLLPLAEQALRLGKRIAFPLCHPKTHKMTFHAVDTLDELTVGAYGIPEPDHHLPTVTANDRTLCIVPALSFDRFGYRLGYGGGYYDRFLSEFAGISVGLVYEALCVEELPRDRYDERVDLIITEKGVNYQNERTQRSKEACDR